MGHLLGPTEALRRGVGLKKLLKSPNFHENAYGGLIGQIPCIFQVWSNIWVICEWKKIVRAKSKTEAKKIFVLKDDWSILDLRTHFAAL